MATVGQKYARHAGALNRLEDVVSLPVTATANTDYVVQIPAGAKYVSYTVFTSTAYGAATDAQIQIGTTAGGSDLVAATTIKAQGVYALTRAAATTAQHVAIPTTVYVRVVQSGTASATGAADLVVGYSLAL